MNKIAFLSIFLFLLILPFVAYPADEVGYATAEIKVPYIEGIANKLVFQFVASTTDGSIPSVTWTIPLDGFVFQSASIPDSASRPSATLSVQILDDTHRDIFEGIMGSIPTLLPKNYAPVSIDSASVPVFVNSTLSAVPATNYATAASFAIEILWTPYLFR